MSNLTLTCTMTCCMCPATQTVPGADWYQRYTGDPVNGWHIAERVVDGKVVELPFCPDHQAAVVAFEAASVEWNHGMAEARRLAGRAFAEANPLPEIEWPEDS